MRESNKWVESSGVATYYFCCLFYFLLRSSRSRRASCNSSRGTSGDNSSNGRRRSPLKGLLGSCPFGGEEYCGVGAPLRYQIYTNSLAPTSWTDSYGHVTKQEVSNLNKPSALLNEGTFDTEEAMAWSKLAAFDASPQFSHRRCPSWRWNSHGLHPSVSCGSRHRRVPAAQTLRSAPSMTFGGASHHEISSARTPISISLPWLHQSKTSWQACLIGRHNF
jgi:hypothetical protein